MCFLFNRIVILDKGQQLGEGNFFIYSWRICCFVGLFSRGLAYVFAVNDQGSVVAIFCLDVHVGQAK